MKPSELMHQVVLSVIERGTLGDKHFLAMVENLIRIEIKLRNRERNVPKVIACQERRQRMRLVKSRVA